MDDASRLLQRRLAAVARAGLIGDAARADRGACARTGGTRACRPRALGRLRANYQRHGPGWSAPDDAAIDADLRWLTTAGAVLLAATDPVYPELLRASPDAPAVLYVLR